jgi:broad specificity phosphatase PhoE
MKLYVTRHGQTEWNLENRVCGITDIQLTNKGMEQAKRLSTDILDKQIDIIISSPLRRAEQTASIISDVIGRNIIFDTRLSEQNYGVYEGVSRENEGFLEAKRHFPNKLCGGESLFQVVQRVYNLLDEIKEKYINNNVLIVTHGSVCRVINSYFCDQSNDDYYTFHISNCEMNEYNY